MMRALLSPGVALVTFAMSFAAGCGPAEVDRPTASEAAPATAIVHATIIDGTGQAPLENDVLAPQIFATGGLLTLPGSHPVTTIMNVPPGTDPETYDWESRGVTLVRSTDEIRAAVRERAAAGMDAIKIVVESGPPGFGDDHPQMPPPMIAAAVEEAEQAGLPVVAHVSSIDELEDAVEGGARALVHAIANPNPEPRHWAEVERRDVFLVPTISLFAGIYGQGWTEPHALEEPFLRSGVAAATLESLSGFEPSVDAPPPVRAQLWATGLDSVRAAHEAGVRIAAGTDTANPLVFPGYSIHRELEFLVAAGLTPMEALVAATRRAAEMIGESDAFGTIEPGRRADLLVLAADPLSDIRNTRTLETVILEGRVLDRSTLLPADGD